MREQYIKEKYLKAYDACADDIFAYCMRETAHRDIAKYLTRNIFLEVWDTVSLYGLDSIKNVKRLIYRTAKDHITKFLEGRKSQMAYYDNLWNLTLSQ